MAGLLFADGFFPFPVPNVQEWDGETLFPTGTDGGTGYEKAVPSLEDDAFKIVCGPGTPYPFGISLEAATMLYWRSRYFLFQYEDLEQTISSDGASVTFNFKDAKTQQGTDGGAEKKETDLILGRDSGANAANSTTDISESDSDSGSSVDVYVQGPLLFFFNEPESLPIFPGPRMVKSGGLYWPAVFPALNFSMRRFFFVDDVLEQEGTVLNPILEYALGTEEEPETPVFPPFIDLGITLFKGSAVFEEVAVSIPVFQDPSVDPISPAITLPSLEVSISKFLTYGGIYDEDTGERN